jgi:FkbM family methyltransferase
VRNATVFECAASDRIGEGWFCVSNGRDDVYSGLESTNLIARPTRIPSYLVTTRPLDTMLEEAEVASIDFATIDVEGHEDAVLRGLHIRSMEALNRAD